MIRLTITAQADRLCILPRDTASYEVLKRAIGRGSPAPTDETLERYRDAVDAGAADERTMFDVDRALVLAASLEALGQASAADELREAVKRLNGETPASKKIAELLTQAERDVHSVDPHAQKKALSNTILAVRLLARELG